MVEKRSSFQEIQKWSILILINKWTIFRKKNIGVDYCCEKKSNCTVFPVVHCRFLTMKERISQTLCFMFILKSDILNQTLWDKAALLLRFFAFKFNKIIPIKLVSSGNKNFMLVRKNQKKSFGLFRLFEGYVKRYFAQEIAVIWTRYWYRFYYI